MLKTVRTKLNKDSKVPIETKMEIDFNGCTSEEIQDLAARAVVIEQQAIYRISGKIPSEDTVSVREMLDRPRGAGVPATPEAILAKFQKLSQEDKAKFLASLK